MKKINLIIRFVISIFIIYFLIDKIGLQNISSNIILIHPLFFILTVFLIVIGLIIGALNLDILLIPIKKISFRKVFYYNTLSWSLGLFVPGKIGELSLIPFLKQEGVPTGHGTVISVLDKLISLVVLSLSSIMGFFIFFDIGTTLKLIAILFLLIAVILFFIVSNAGRSFIKKYILRKFSMKFQGFSKLLFYYFAEFGRRAICCEKLKNPPCHLSQNQSPLFGAIRELLLDLQSDILKAVFYNYSTGKNSSLLQPSLAFG